MSVYSKICINMRTAGLIVILLMSNGIMSFALTSNNDSSISLSFAMGDSDPSNVEFRLYKIAGLKDNEYLELTDPYRKYENRIRYLNGEAEEDDDSDVILSLTQSLSLYTDKDCVIPEKTEITDENGKCLFEGLEDGMYLIKGRGTVRDNRLYIPQSCIVLIGNDLTTDKSGSYDVVIKSECRILDGKSTGVSVVKIWSGSESSGGHPDHVDMVLMKDGIVSDKVELSEKNGWKHEWSGLDKRYVWTAVEEEIPDGYIFSPEIKGNSYIITNNSEKSNNGNNKAAVNNINKKPESKLPQTGIMWKYAVLCYAAGVIFIASGIRINRKKKISLYAGKTDLLRRQ